MNTRQIPAPVREWQRGRGFTLIEIMIAIAIAALIASIAIPYFITYRSIAQTKTCMANLRQIEGAKEQWCLETKRAPGDACVLTDLAGPDKYIKGSPSCPAGFTYDPQAVGLRPICQSGIVDHALP